MKQNRKNWSNQEDQTIIILVRKYGTKRWTLISEKMKQRFPEDGRSGKQCRERWHNHLSPIINKQPWSESQIKLVFDTHRKYGNKWTQIAQLLPGRTDNAVKNQFYSTLRKGLRRICKILGTRNSTTRIKKIKPSALSNLITNFTEFNIGDAEKEEEFYDMLFQFSSGDRFGEFRDKEVTEKYKQKMEQILQKIIDSKQSGKKRRGKGVNRGNRQLQNNQQQIEAEEIKSNEEGSQEINQEKSEEKQSNQDQNNFQFNIDLDDKSEKLENKIPQQMIFDPDFGDNNCPNIHEELDSRLQKPISLKKQNSLAQSLKDDENLPLLKKRQSYQPQRVSIPRIQNMAEMENSENYFKNFLSKSPNFSSRFKMPTPKVQDGCNTSGMFFHTFEMEHFNEEPVEKYCNLVVEEVRASIKAKTEGRGRGNGRDWKNRLR